MSFHKKRAKIGIILSKAKKNRTFTHFFNGILL